MKPGTAAQYLTDAKALTERFKAGSGDSPRAFGELVQLLLQLTVVKEGASVTYSSRREPGKAKEVHLISGRGQKALPLSDDRYFWLSFSLFREQVDESKHRLKVARSAFCYQADEKGDCPIFRYEFLREPPDPHPGSHAHVHGTLSEPDCLPAEKPLHKVHFPTRRIPLEAILRLLIQEFGVQARTDVTTWRPVLAWTENAFLEIAHEQISDP